MRDWGDLPYFLAVARSGSLRAAAAECGATHATVDRHLTALEANFGVRLFDRTRGGLVLTEAGQALIPMAEEAETAILGARRRLTGLDREATGPVRLSAPPGLAYDLLPPILARFEAAHPRIDLRISLTNRMADLGRHEADVSLRIAYSVDDDVLGRRVLTYVTGIYASQSYVDRHFAGAGPNGEGLTWIGWGEREPRPQWLRDSPFPAAALRHGVPSALMVARLAQAGMGMSWLPCYFETIYPGLVRVPDTPVREDRSIWLLLHSDLRDTTRVRLLVEAISEGLRAQRAAFRGPLA